MNAWAPQRSHRSDALKVCGAGAVVVMALSSCVGGAGLCIGRGCPDRSPFARSVFPVTTRSWRDTRIGVVSSPEKSGREAYGRAKSPDRALLSFPLAPLAPLAQLAEQRTLNPRVRGSSPWRRTL